MRLSRADTIKAKELSEKYGLDIEVIKKIISSPYDFIQKKTKELNFKDGLTREEFDKMKKNFNIPGLGKLYASYYLYEQIQKKRKKN
tara:strand:- start:16412 stop:16672 length:261 start_codon:yes stop_codon:yes gene_type:complete